VDVLFFINDLQIGGAQSVVRLLAKNLAEQGYQTGIVTETPISPGAQRLLPCSVKQFSYEASTGKHRERLFFRSIFGNLARVVAIRHQIRRHGPSLVVSFLSQTNIVVILATSFLTPRVVVSERGNMAAEPLPWPWRILRRLTYFQADLVTTNNEDSYRILRRFVSYRKLKILPNPLPSLQQMHVPKDPQSQKSILYVGRLSYEKGVHILLTAYSDMTRRYPACPALVIVGDGPSRIDLEILARKLSLQEKIIWKGEQHNVAKYYSNAHFLVVPSLREGLPNVVLEALAFELPIIITACSMATKAYVKDGYNGFVVPPANSESLAQAMTKLYLGKELHRRFSVFSGSLAKQLSPDEVFAKWSAAFGLAKPREQRFASEKSKYVSIDSRS